MGLVGVNLEFLFLLALCLLLFAAFLINFLGCNHTPHHLNKRRFKQTEHKTIEESAEVAFNLLSDKGVTALIWFAVVNIAEDVVGGY